MKVQSFILKNRTGLLGSPKHICGYNIKVDLNKVGCAVEDWIQLTENKVL
jgi:hypothetical protein